MAYTRSIFQGDRPIVFVKSLLEVGGLVVAAPNLALQRVELVLVLEPNKDLLASPVVVRDQVVEYASTVLFDVVETEPVVAKDAANALVVAKESDDVGVVVVHGEGGVHLFRWYNTQKDVTIQFYWLS